MSDSGDVKDKHMQRPITKATKAMISQINRFPVQSVVRLVPGAMSTNTSARQSSKALSPPDLENRRQNFRSRMLR